jgi:hypothetical protein
MKDEEDDELKRIRSRLCALSPVGTGWEKLNAVAQVILEERDALAERFDGVIAELRLENARVFWKNMDDDLNRISLMQSLMSIDRCLTPPVKKKSRVRWEPPGFRFGTKGRQ